MTPLTKRSARPSIEIQIDRLVLHGLPVSPVDRERVGGALAQELARLLADSDPPATLTRPAMFPSLAVGTMRLAPGATPELTGAHLARAVYRSLSANPREPRR